MKTFIKVSLCAIIGILHTTSASETKNQNHDKHTELESYADYRVREAMQKFIVPNINIESLSLEDSVAFLERMLKIYLQSITEKDLSIDIVIPDSMKDMKVSLKAKNITAYDALKDIAKQCMLDPAFRAGNVYLEPSK